jgi:hypothetical protein
MADNDRRLPAWLLGLLIAILLFTALLFLAIAFGYGDAPSIDGTGAVLS